MSGVKGRSGRKSIPEEMRRHMVIDKAWRLTDERLDNPNDPKRYDTAEALAVKSMVDKQSVQMDARISQEEQGILDKYISRNRVASSSAS